MCSFIQRGNEQELRCCLGIGVIIGVFIFGVDRLRHTLPLLGDVMTDGIVQGRFDFLDSVQHQLVIEINVIDIQKIRFFRCAALIELPDNLAHQADKTARLLKSLIFLKSGIQILDGRVEGVGIPHTDKDLIRCIIRQA